MLKIIEAINLLKRKGHYRGIFHSEADFQFQFGLALKELHSDIDIIFEMPYSRFEDYNRETNESFCRKNGKIDIVVIKHGIKIPIELKYFTKRITDEVENSLPELSDQNDSWRLFDVLKDIQRNEFFITDNNGILGYSILITNNPHYWEDKPRGNYKYSNFKINENFSSIGPGVLEWINVDDSNDLRTKTNICLKQKYQIKWNDYVKLINENENQIEYGHFRFIVFESNKTLFE